MLHAREFLSWVEVSPPPPLGKKCLTPLVSHAAFSRGFPVSVFRGIHHTIALSRSASVHLGESRVRIRLQTSLKLTALWFEVSTLLYDTSVVRCRVTGEGDGCLQRGVESSMTRLLWCLLRQHDAFDILHLLRSMVVFVCFAVKIK